METKQDYGKKVRLNKGRLIGGIICVAAAVLLAVLSVTLPEGKVVFMIGDSNAVYVPIFVLAGVGLWLLATVTRR
jgi:hypothetical protein